MKLEAKANYILMSIFGAVVSIAICAVIFFNSQSEKDHRTQLALTTHALFERILSDSIRAYDIPEMTRILKRSRTKDMDFFMYAPQFGQLALSDMAEFEFYRAIALTSSSCAGDWQTIDVAKRKINIFCRLIKASDTDRHFLLYQISLSESSLLTPLFVGLLLLMVMLLILLSYASTRTLRGIFFKPLGEFESYIGERLSSLSQRGSFCIEDGLARANELERLKSNFDSVLDQARKALDLEKRELESETKIRVTHQVAHDIRSPLSALEMMSSQLRELPEDKRIVIRSAIHRIRDIANSLVGEKRDGIIQAVSNFDPIAVLNLDIVLETVLLAPIIESLVTEKRMQFRRELDVDIIFEQSFESYGLSASINLTEFNRAISNLVNNAVEASDNGSKVEIHLRPSDSKSQVIIEISDNGKGMSQQLLEKIGERGFTVGKAEGSGLGLAHAKKTFKHFGGNLSIYSEVGVGTTVTLCLPRKEPPRWFVPKLQSKLDQSIIIFDDDQSIHQIWKGRFESASQEESKVNLEYLNTIHSFRNFIREKYLDLESAMFLMDYEILGTNETGLDLISEFGLEQYSILVTSRYEDPEVRGRCEQMGVRLIPKTMSGFVPVEIL